MRIPLVLDDFWAAIAPLPPLGPVRPKESKPRRNDRVAFCGVMFLLHSDVPWELVLCKLG